MNSRPNDVIPSTSASTPVLESSKEQSISTGASAQKVSEVFLAAGQAFQKLGGLIANLHNPRSGAERKWTSSDTNSLHDAVSRFASDLQRISETVQGREVQLMKDDIINRPSTGHYIKAVSSRTNGTAAMSSATGRSSLKRTGSVSHSSADPSFKRRVISTAPSGITVSSGTRYANVTHIQSLNVSSPAMSRMKSGQMSVVPSALTTVTVQSNMPSVVLPPEPKVHNGPRNFDGGVLNI